MKEGKEKGNQKIVKSARPKVMPAPQPGIPQQVDQKLSDKEDLLENLIDILFKQITEKSKQLLTKKPEQTTLAEMGVAELMALKELANAAVVKNKYPGGDQELIQICANLAGRIDDETNKRLKSY